MLIDCLQYCNWSEKIFRQWKEGGVDAVHVTIAYHEDFGETVANITRWQGLFERFGDRITHAVTAADIEAAKAEGKTAVLFGLQNPFPIGDDVGLVGRLHGLGVRFMQITYNKESLLGSGCYEAKDTGLTPFGREVIDEMNRLGFVVDCSHAGERTTLDAIGYSSRPVAISHANPAFWHEAPRNISGEVLKALAASGGMLGFSLYPHHMKDGSGCALESFCEMVARTAEIMGVEHIGFGSDLCQDQPDAVVRWMRRGHWEKMPDDGEIKFPAMPSWFRDNRDWGKVFDGLAAVGFTAGDIDRIKGGNWLEFYRKSFGG